MSWKQRIPATPKAAIAESLLWGFGFRVEREDTPPSLLALVLLATKSALRRDKVVKGAVETWELALGLP